MLFLESGSYRIDLLSYHDRIYILNNKLLIRNCQ